VAIPNGGFLGIASDEQNLEVRECLPCRIGHLSPIHPSWKANIRKQKIYTSIGSENLQA
jgi:hypothetical protein